MVKRPLVLRSDARVKALAGRKLVAAGALRFISICAAGILFVSRLARLQRTTPEEQPAADRPGPPPLCPETATQAAMAQVVAMTAARDDNLPGGALRFTGLSKMPTGPGSTCSSLSSHCS